MERPTGLGWENPHWTDKITRVCFAIILLSTAKFGYDKINKENREEVDHISVSQKAQNQDVVYPPSPSPVKSSEAKVENPARLRFYQTLEWMQESDRDPLIQAVVNKLLPLKDELGDAKSTVFAYTDSGILRDKPFNVTTQGGPGGYIALIGFSPDAILNKGYSNQDLAKYLFEAVYVYSLASEDPYLYAHDTALQDRLSREADQLANTLFLQGSSK